jgi:hypothetical protein
MENDRVLYRDVQLDESGNIRTYVVYAKNKPGIVGFVFGCIGSTLQNIGHKIATCGIRITNKGVVTARKEIG